MSELAEKRSLPFLEKVYIGFGSNLGEREENLRRALRLLREEKGITVTGISSLYLAEPVGYNDQREFFNGVAEAVTSLSPGDLLKLLKKIEKSLGRKPGIRWGPRIIDLDILLYGSRVIETAELIIPHPRMHERRFVLAPLAEIAPEVRHPLLGLDAAGMLAALTRDKKVARLGEWTGK